MNYVILCFFKTSSQILLSTNVIIIFNKVEKEKLSNLIIDILKSFLDMIILISYISYWFMDVHI